jgi:hypothetical protein
MQEDRFNHEGDCLWVKARVLYDEMMEDKA